MERYGFSSTLSPRRFMRSISNELRSLLLSNPSRCSRILRYPRFFALVNRAYRPRKKVIGSNLESSEGRLPLRVSTSKKCTRIASIHRTIVLMQFAIAYGYVFIHRTPVLPPNVLPSANRCGRLTRGLESKLARIGPKTLATLKAAGNSRNTRGCHGLGAEPTVPLIAPLTSRPKTAWPYVVLEPTPMQPKPCQSSLSAAPSSCPPSAGLQPAPIVCS